MTPTFRALDESIEMAEKMKLITRDKLTLVDIAKINRKYNCAPHKYYLGDDLTNAIKSKDFDSIRINKLMNKMEQKR